MEFEELFKKMKIECDRSVKVKGFLNFQDYLQQQKEVKQSRKPKIPGMDHKTQQKSKKKTR